jgi:predicted dehydrogenase
MHSLNFAVIGCGMLARAQHLPNIVRNPRARLRVCCDLSESTLAVCRNQFGAERTSTDWQAAITDPEVQVIVLATTEKLRLPVIAVAAAAGKAVYVEKPVATTLAEMREIQRIVHAAGIPFCVGHNRRCAPAMCDAHQIFRAHMTQPQPCPWRFKREGEELPRLAKDGVPGISVRINDDWYSWKRWVFDKTQAPHGALLFEMTHFTDVCNWFLADEPVEVMAMESGMLNHGVVIRYRGGALATIAMSANGTFGYPKELYELMGQGGIVVVDHMVEVRTAGIAGAPARKTYEMHTPDGRPVPAPNGILDWLNHKRAACAQANASGDPLKQFAADPDKGHARMLDCFIDQILGAGPEVCGADAAVQATRVAFAAIRSAHERRVVTLDEI